MSGYGPLYWPCSCPRAMAERADAINSNSTAVILTATVVTVVVTVADERILQTAAGEPEDQVVTCQAAAPVAAAATAAEVVVISLLQLLWSSRVTTTIIGHGLSAHAAGRVSSPNSITFANARAHAHGIDSSHKCKMLADVSVTAFPVPLSLSLPVR